MTLVRGRRLIGLVCLLIWGVVVDVNPAWG